jgi:hypothetical protein
LEEKLGANAIVLMECRAVPIAGLNIVAKRKVLPLLGI